MIKAIIGLGNPGAAYLLTRHSIGFRILDALAEQLAASWRSRENMHIATASAKGKTLLLIKPQTFMNNSGAVIPFLAKQGIKPEEILVVHDELELPFGKIAVKTGGSAKGHNGLKSIIAACGPDFHRLRFGISRPEKSEDVPDYVLQTFREPAFEVDALIEQAVELIKSDFLK